MIISHTGKFIIATPTKTGTTTLESIARRHARNAERDTSGALSEHQFRMVSVEDRGGPRRQHAMVPPYGAEDYARMLTVRSPFRRYMSVFEYLGAPQNYSQWGAREVQRDAWPGQADHRRVPGDPMTFAEFLGWLVAVRAELRYLDKKRGPVDDPSGRAFRSPWVWTDGQLTSYNFLKNASGGVWRNPWGPGGPGLIRLENLYGELQRLAKMLGGKGGPLAGVDFSDTIHANRSLRYVGGAAARGDRGPVSEGDMDMVRRYWGPVVRRSCRPGLLSDDGKAARKSVGVGGCGNCLLCRTGVVGEAVGLGYLHG